MQTAMLALALFVGQETTKRDWTVDGVKREALMHAPVKKQVKPPLVLVFHGHGGTMGHAARRMNMHGLWPEALVVYPQGLNTKGKLSDPEGKKPGWQHAAGDESDRDLKFVDAMLESLAKEFDFDPARVYVTGHSNGGSFTYLLWATRHEKLAAVAPSGSAGRVAATVKPLPCLHVAGEKDPLVKFAWQQRTMDVVRKINGGDTVAKPWAEKGKIHESKTGTPLATYIHPGGHEYPDAAPALIVKFFQEHVRTAK